jgi:hypothetical protein
MPSVNVFGSADFSGCCMSFMLKPLWVLNHRLTILNTLDMLNKHGAPIVTKKIPAAGEPGPASMFFRLWMTACLLAALQRIGFRIKVSGMDERAD